MSPGRMQRLESSNKEGPEDEVTFGGSFSSHDKYAGSFRLKFATNDSQRRKRSTSVEDAVRGADASSAGLIQDESREVEEPKDAQSLTPGSETQQLCLKFITEGQQKAYSYSLLLHIYDIDLILYKLM